MQDETEARPIGQVITLPVNRPLTLAERWRQSLNNKPSPAQVIGLLTSCLALVRPAGLSDDNARDWLRMASSELGYIPIDILADAAAHARRTCDHHSKIVPAIVKFADAEIAERRRHIVRSDEYAQDALPASSEPHWVPEPGELERIKADVAAQFPSRRGPE